MTTPDVVQTMTSQPSQPFLTMPVMFARVLNRASNGALYAAIQSVIASGAEPRLSVERTPMPGSRHSSWTISVLGGASPILIAISNQNGVAVLAAGNLWIRALADDLREELRLHVDEAIAERASADFIPGWLDSRGSTGGIS